MFWLIVFIVGAVLFAPAIRAAHYPGADLSSVKAQEPPPIPGQTENVWVLGQKDVEKGRMHLWIKNRRHTWKNVVDGVPIPRVSATIVVTGFRPGTYLLAWYDTYAATYTDIEGLTIGEDGAARLQVVDLAKDVAVQMFQWTNYPPRVVSFSPDGGVGQLSTYQRFTTVFTDTNGYDDIDWVSFMLDRAQSAAARGLVAFYDQERGEFSMLGVGSCVPGDPDSDRFLDVDYALLDCRTSHAVGAGDTLTVTWSIGFRECFQGGCGDMEARALVRDSFAELDYRKIGSWWLEPWTAQ